MNSENPPAIYTLAALRALPEWKESGRVLNLSTVEDPEFQDIVSSVPDTMRLTGHGRDEFLPWPWKDLPTAMTNSYHGRGKLVIP